MDEKLINKEEDEVKEEVVNKEDDVTRPSPETEESASIESIADTEEPAGQQPEVDQSIESKEEMFTQSQVNELVGKARREGRESERQAWLKRYGVDTEDEMNDLFGKGQTYADLNTDFETQGNELKLVKSENALLKSGIDPSRWDDAKAILNMKGLEVSEENIRQMLPTHPEWMKVSAQGGLTEENLKEFAKAQGTTTPQESPAKLMKLGNDPTPLPEKSEKEEAMNIFFGNK